MTYDSSTMFLIPVSGAMTHRWCVYHQEQVIVIAIPGVCVAEETWAVDVLVLTASIHGTATVGARSSHRAVASALCGSRLYVFARLECSTAQATKATLNQFVLPEANTSGVSSCHFTASC